MTEQAHDNTISGLHQQIRLLKQQIDQLETEKYILNQQLEDQSSIILNQERNTPTPGKTFMLRYQTFHQKFLSRFDII